VAVVEGVVAEVDLRRRPFAQLAQYRVLADLRQPAALHQRPSRLRARCTAARTCAGAVPPAWSRAATDPSGVRIFFTSELIFCEKALSLESGRAARSTPAFSASRTARATIPCASRNGTPLRTR